MPFISVASLLMESVEDLEKQALDSTEPSELEAVASLKAEKEKAYLKMPNIKPPRRKKFNKSETREYRNEYQKEYREENGNGYIPKGR